MKTIAPHTNILICRGYDGEFVLRLRYKYTPMWTMALPKQEAYLPKALNRMGGRGAFSTVALAERAERAVRLIRRMFGNLPVQINLSAENFDRPIKIDGATDHRGYAYA